MTEFEFVATFGESVVSIFKDVETLERVKFVKMCYDIVKNYPSEDLWDSYYNTLMDDGINAASDFERCKQNRDKMVSESLIDFEKLGCKRVKDNIVVFVLLNVFEKSVKNYVVRCN